MAKISGLDAAMESVPPWEGVPDSEQEQRVRGASPLEMLQRLLRNRSACAGGLIVVLTVACTVLGPIVDSVDPTNINPIMHLQPIGSAGHPLGTDLLGRDMLARLLDGGRLSLFAGVVSALISTVLGVLLGMVAGFAGALLDNLIMRLLDILLGFPFILLAILIVAFAGPSTVNAMIAIAIASIPFFARITRGLVMSLKAREFVTAAYALGAGHTRVLFVHILLNLWPAIVATLFLNIGFMITQTSALSFLGLGTQPPTPDWGTMLADSESYMGISTAIASLPGIAIVVSVIGFNLLGNGLRDVVNGAV